MTKIEFQSWGKIPRLSKSQVTVTEKIDGTNACIQILPVGREGVHVPEPRDVGGLGYSTYNGVDVLVGAQSRNKLIFPGKATDNAGFAGYVADNVDELVQLLGPGRHFGEWWGQGIQRGYGMTRKVFSLFNTHAWQKKIGNIEGFATRARDINLGVVPVLYTGKFNTQAIETRLDLLRVYGSVAAELEGLYGMLAEGVVIYHHDLKAYQKAFVENDDVHKGEQ